MIPKLLSSTIMLLIGTLLKDLISATNSTLSPLKTVSP